MKHHAKLNLQVTIIQADWERFHVEADLSNLLIRACILSLLHQDISCVA